MTAYMGLLDFKSSNRCIMLPSYTHACVALECALYFVCLLHRCGHLDHLLYTTGAEVDQGRLTVTAVSDAHVSQFALLLL